jgi:hypothetical protein
MVANLTQICRSVPRKHDSGIVFPDWCYDEGVEEIFNGDAQTIGKERSLERALGNVFDVYWKPQESGSDIMLNILWSGRRREIREIAKAFIELHLFYIFYINMIT